jgi:hypothetical protein
MVPTRNKTHMTTPTKATRLHQTKDHTPKTLTRIPHTPILQNTSLKEAISIISTNRSRSSNRNIQNTVPKVDMVVDTVVVDTVVVDTVVEDIKVLHQPSKELPKLCMALPSLLHMVLPRVARRGLLKRSLLPPTLVLLQPIQLFDHRLILASLLVQTNHTPVLPLPPTFALLTQDLPHLVHHHHSPARPSLVSIPRKRHTHIIL